MKNFSLARVNGMLLLGVLTVIILYYGRSFLVPLTFGILFAMLMVPVSNKLEKWGLGRFPTAADLDAAVSNRPVWLERVDGHAGWANSEAMKEAGVTEQSVAPAGGKIEKVGRKPSGIFIDAASELVQKAVPAPLPRVREQAFAKAQEITRIDDRIDLAV